MIMAVAGVVGRPQAVSFCELLRSALAGSRVERDGR